MGQLYGGPLDGAETKSTNWGARQLFVPLWDHPLGYTVAVYELEFDGEYHYDHLEREEGTLEYD